MRSLFTGIARRGPAAPWAASFVFALALAASTLHAQPPNPLADSKFVRSRTFDLPFNLTAADKANVRELKLYVSTDPPAAWQLHATATPAQTKYDSRTSLQVGNFDVRLDRDGAHAFAIMTVFNDGSSVPISVDQLRKDQSVTVDTKPPTITLKALPPRAKPDGGSVVGLEWKVEDENLVRESIRMEGRYFGAANWTNFFRGTGPEESGRQEWSLRAGLRMEIRMIAADRAGNQTIRNILLSGNGVGTMTGGGPGPANDGMGSHSPGPSASQPGYKLVNTKTVKLQYKVRERPPSGLESIELYVVRSGNDWKKHDKAFDAPPPDSDTAEITFEAKEDAVYGLTMIARSRAGVVQPPPKSNDPPQIWVEVDTTKPTAELKTVKLAQPNDGRSLILEWKAADKNLEALPIIFEYSEVEGQNANPTSKWQELTTPLPNSGRYVCAAPQLPNGVYLFKVRMTVWDKAGNYTIVEWKENISADVTRPQVEIIDAKTVRPEAAPKVP